MRSIDEIAKYIKNWRIGKGFKTPSSLDTAEERDSMLGKLMLVVTEVAEAAEAVRKNDLNNFREELADTTIRILDITSSMGIDHEADIAQKMRENENRAYLHGKHTTI